MTWPPRWSTSQFKHDQPNRRVAERQDKLKLVTAERRSKEKVRKRDVTCRFPLCGCKAFRRHTEVSHADHKGMGGDPTGQKSLPEGLILLCPFRHKENRISVDRGTLRIVPNTDARLAGPCTFYVQQSAVLPGAADRWVEVGRETARHVFEPFTPAQKAILTKLAGMTS